MHPTQSPCRLRDLGILLGKLDPGAYNAITDVPGVRVGHHTRRENHRIHTGATAILPHNANLFQEKVPAGLAVGNGFGKLMGSTQLVELGEIEAPIVLTNTLSVPQAADASLTWILGQPGNEEVVSVNVIIGETNDSKLNDIRQRVLTSADILDAIENAVSGPVAEGAIGAGTGTVAFGWKGGIGTSSRRVPAFPDGSPYDIERAAGPFTVGVLVQSNFGGQLRIDGIPWSHLIRTDSDVHMVDAIEAVDGSIMIVVATDLPLSDRNLTRLARRALAGLARTGAAMSNGSGDYALAFSTHPAVRRNATRRSQVAAYPDVPNDWMSGAFLATIEATEEAILNSLLMATTTTGYRGTVHALPIDVLRQAVQAGHWPIRHDRCGGG